MTQDEIIEMARQAGIDPESDTLCRFEGWVEPFETFAKMVAKHTLLNIDPSSFMSFQEGIEAGRFAEREECAKILDANAMACHTPIMRSLLQSNAQAIRARGQV